MAPYPRKKKFKTFLGYIDFSKEKCGASSLRCSDDAVHHH